MKKSWIPVAALLLAAAAEPASAQPADARDIAAEIGVLGEKGELSAALAKTDAALATFVEPGYDRGLMLYLRAALLTEMQRYKEALASLEPAIAMLPDAPVPRRMLAILQAAEGQPVEASRTVVHIADRFPNEVASLDSMWIGSLMRELDEKKAVDARFEMALALASRGYNDADEPGAVDWIMAEAIVGLLRRDRADEARPLLARLTDASTLLEMLVDRQYEPLWPDLEAQAGPRGARAMATDLAATQAAHRRDPKNLASLRTYMNALCAVGRTGEAAALGAPFTADLAAIEKAGEDGFWLVNAQASALAESGRFDEGDRLLGKLLTLKIADYPDLISMAINRGAALVEFGRPAEALAAANFVKAQGEQAMSDYGRMWNWRTETCALQALGRTADAQAVLARIEALKDKNVAAHTMAMLCHDRLDVVEKVVIERLADPDKRGTMLLALQDFRAGQQANADDALREKLLSLRARPAVRKAIEASGRILSIDADRTYWGSF